MADSLRDTCNPKQWAKAEVESNNLKWNLFSAAKAIFKDKFKTRERGCLLEDGSLDNPAAEFVFQFADREADGLIRKFARSRAEQSKQFIIISNDASLVLGVPAATYICSPNTLKLCRNPDDGEFKRMII